MNLYQKLQQREQQEKPILVGMIGVGKFGSMYLAQVPKTPGVEVVGISDLSPSQAKSNLLLVGWTEDRLSVKFINEAVKNNLTCLTDDWESVVSHPSIDLLVESTGSPSHAVDHILGAFEHGKHVVNVIFETDAFCGPLLIKKALSAGVVCSLAFGDQPAMICDLVELARVCGFPVTAAGRGHKWLPDCSETQIIF